MILACDIGNTNITLGAYEGNAAAFTSRIKTDPLKTEAEYAVLIRSILELHRCPLGRIEGAVISSVVPPLSSVLRQALRLLGPMKLLTVGPGIKTGLNIRIDDPGTLGADLLATAIGAMEKYPLPAIIVNLGTATKLTAVDRNRTFLGGCIMPGVMIALKALYESTAQLPQIELQEGIGACHRHQYRRLYAFRHRAGHRQYD